MTEASLNIPNVSRLIAHLEVLPDDKFDMRTVFRRANGSDVYSLDDIDVHACGTAGCIAGWCNVLAGVSNISTSHARDWIGITDLHYFALFMPAGYKFGSQNYPLSRAIRTLKHMRSEFLRTGQVVVDWDAPEPEPLKAWVAPRAIEQKLPAEITRFLGSPSHVEAL